MTEDKVIWLEGAFITPQHFQQQERYFEAKQAQAWNIHTGGLHGFSECVIDLSTCKLGQVTLARAKGVLPDGTFFKINKPITVKIPESINNCKVVLTLPAKVENDIEISLERDQEPRRYKMVSNKVYDTHNQDNAATQLQTAMLNFCLDVSEDIKKPCIGITLALIKEVRADTGICLDNEYIPPITNLSASPCLMSELKALFGSVNLYCQTLLERLKISTEYKSQQVLLKDQMWLNVLCLWRGELGFLLEHAMGVSPIMLYKQLFSMSNHISALSLMHMPDPQFCHPEKLTEIFREQFRYLSSNLQLVSEEKVFEIMIDKSCFQTSRLYSAVLPKGNIKAARCILAVEGKDVNEGGAESFPNLCIVAPLDNINDYIRSSVTGINMFRLKLPPVELKLIPQLVYFELDTCSVLWQQLIASASKLGFHLDYQLGEIDIRMFMINENDERI